MPPRRKPPARKPVHKVDLGHKPVGSPAVVRQAAMARPAVHPAPPGGATRPAPKRHRPSEKQRFIWAEREQESGGNYSAVNGSSGALGAYQVLPSNLPGWLADSGLPQMSDSAYLANHRAQDLLAWHILGGYYDKYGPRGAAAVWYSGQPDWHATYGNPPVYQYVNDVIALMNGTAADQSATGIAGGGLVIPKAPTVVADSWHKQIHSSATEVAHAATAFGNNSTYIKNLLPRQNR